MERMKIVLLASAPLNVQVEAALTPSVFSDGLSNPHS